jgi:hypothetical protein
MDEDLEFGPTVSLTDAALPYNYVPAAFADWMSLPEVQSRVLISLSDPDNLTNRRNLRYHLVNSGTQNNPAGLARFVIDLAGDAPEAADRCLFGPPSRPGLANTNPALALDYPPLEPGPGPAPARIAVLIDIGIAFWNERFRSTNAPRFKGMWFLDFDAPLDGKSTLTLLDTAEVDSLCKSADLPGGTTQVAADLGARFPGSWYGPNGGALPDGFWHGTAMADLMAGLPPGTADDTALYGIELPMAVLRDADGDSLSAVLPLMVEAALALTDTFSGLPLTIVLPWGFSAGPQDGSHPAVQAIDRVLVNARRTAGPQQPGRDVTLIVPAGNQLQDRCCGVLAAGNAGDPDQMLRWHLPPDDFSQNAVEISIRPAGPPSAFQRVRIVPPMGPPIVAMLKEREAIPIKRGNDLVGLLIRFRDTGGGARLRLVLAPTGWGGRHPRPAPAGDWRLAFGAQDAARVWVLRDDRDRVLDGPLPRRMSRLLDDRYRDEDAAGRPPLTDDPGSLVVRSGTASLLASAQGVMAVQAIEATWGQVAAQTVYSGRKADGTLPAEAVLVDPGRPGRGMLAAANGGNRRLRVSGTSAAAALRARAALGLPTWPLD